MKIVLNPQKAEILSVNRICLKFKSLPKIRVILYYITSLLEAASKEGMVAEVGLKSLCILFGQSKYPPKVCVSLLEAVIQYPREIQK